MISSPWRRHESLSQCPTTKPARHSLGKAFNLPNQLTSLRLLLSVVLFGLISAEHYIAAFVLFLIAVGTDWLDGYYARKFNQITTLGRILDPFADKVIVCGTFIFILVAPGMRDAAWGSAGMDGRGDRRPRIAGDGLAEFPGRTRQRLFGELSGKLKMVLQCVAAGSALVYLHCLQPVGQAAPSTAPQWVYWFTVVSIWSAVILTVYSGAIYVWIAYKLLKQKTDASDA